MDDLADLCPGGPDPDGLFRVPPTTRVAVVYRCIRDDGVTAYVETSSGKVLSAAPILSRWARPGQPWAPVQAALEEHGYRVVSITSIP